MTLFVYPLPAVRAELIMGHQLPALIGNFVDRVDDEFENFFGNEIIEIDPDPAWLNPLAALDNGRLKFGRPR